MIKSYIERQRQEENRIQKFTYLSQKESFGNICGYFSTGCNENFPKVLENQVINVHINVWHNHCTCTLTQKLRYITMPHVKSIKRSLFLRWQMDYFKIFYSSIKYRISGMNLLKKPVTLSFSSNNSSHKHIQNSRLMQDGASYSYTPESRWQRISITPEPNSLPMLGQWLNLCPKLHWPKSKSQLWLISVEWSSKN